MSKEGLCGAFSAGVMIIGALQGRSDPDQDDSLCQDMVLDYRRRFQQRFDTLNCGDLRRVDYGSDNREPCSVLVERAVRLLLDTLKAFDQLENPA